MSSQSVSVKHNPTENRFETTVDSHIGYVGYDIEGNDMVITHTIVPEEIGGRGIAQALVKKALDHAREKKMKVKPQCSYAAKFMERNASEYEDLLSR